MWPLWTREMTAPIRPSGRNGTRGGGHGLSAGRGGARHESPRCDPASPGGEADVDPGRRDLGAQCPQHSAAAAEVRAVWLRRALRPPAPDALSQAGARGRGATPLGAVPRAVSRLQRPALPPPRAPQAPGALLLCLREEGPAGGGPRGQTAAPGPPSTPARATGMLRRAAASGRQPASVAGAAPGAMVHADRRGRRRHQASALRAALSRRRKRAGRDAGPAGRAPALRHSHGAVYRPGALGGAHPRRRRGPGPRPAYPSRPSLGSPGRRTHPGLFPAGARSQ